MNLRLGKNAVFFKNTFCLSKKKCINGQNTHDTLVNGHEYLLQNWCLLQFSWKCDGFESKYCSALIVLAEMASAKVLIFVLALALALAVASATKNWDLYSLPSLQDCNIYTGCLNKLSKKNYSYKQLEGGPIHCYKNICKYVALYCSVLSPMDLLPHPHIMHRR